MTLQLRGRGRCRSPPCTVLLTGMIYSFRLVFFIISMYYALLMQLPRRIDTEDPYYLLNYFFLYTSDFYKYFAPIVWAPGYMARLLVRSFRFFESNMECSFVDEKNGISLCDLRRRVYLTNIVRFVNNNYFDGLVFICFTQASSSWMFFWCDVFFVYEPSLIAMCYIHFPVFIITFILSFMLQDIWLMDLYRLIRIRFFA